MAAVKTEAAITFERLAITMRFQLRSHIFDQARLGYDTVDIARHFWRRPPNEFKRAATETESGNNYRTQLNWRQDSNATPYIWRPMLDTLQTLPALPDVSDYLEFKWRATKEVEITFER